ncbi:MAG TPA: hypothetical protein VFN02_00995, partial [Ktedonobacteraceae bacterium]|nr:hypothetical protein [Ktedonobacteraceae bacterium]
SIAMPMDEGSSVTQDLSYITLGSPDHRSLEIIQASSGRKIAIVATPDYARSYRHSMLITTKQYIMLFQKKAMYIWSISTGKLLYTYHGSLPYFDDESQWVEFSLAPDSRHLIITGFRASRPGMASQPDMATTAVWSLP